MNRVVDQQLFDRIKSDLCETEYRTGPRGVTPTDIKLPAGLHRILTRKDAQYLLGFLARLPDIEGASDSSADGVALHRLRWNGHVYLDR